MSVVHKVKNRIADIIGCEMTCAGSGMTGLVCDLWVHFLGFLNPFFDLRPAGQLPHYCSSGFVDRRHFGMQIFSIAIAQLFNGINP